MSARMNTRLPARSRSVTRLNAMVVSPEGKV
jgi:hypothetical protein